MAKRLLSLSLSLALLLSCVSGITLFTMAEAGEPYVWFDTASGEFDCNWGPFSDAALADDSDAAPVEEIGATGEFGIPVNAGDVGFYWGDEFVKDVPAGQSVTFVVKYYVDGDVSGEAFTYQIGDGNDAVSVSADTLTKNETAVLFITPTADELATATADGDWFRIFFIGEAANVYIRAAELLDTDCTVMADADAFHAYMVEAEINTAVENKVDATDFEAGYTGDIVCNTCGDVLAAGEEIPATSESGLPAPYAYFDTKTGAVVGNAELVAGGVDPIATQIPGTDMYGIRLGGDWQGFGMKATLPADKDVAMVVEYYVDKDFNSWENNQLFRYQAYEGWQGGNSDADGNTWTNMFSEAESISPKKTSVMVYTFTEADKTAIGNGEFVFTLKGTSSGANQVYVKSMYLVAAEYTDKADTSDNGFAFVDFVGKEQSEYHPGVVSLYNANASWSIREADATFDGFTYIKLYGAVNAADRFTNKPILIKVYAAEGHENGSVHINAFEVSKDGGESTFSGDQGIVAPDIQLADGVGTLLLNACFTNNLNAAGSLRFEMAEAAKIARIEFYDASTFCLDPNADADEVASVHAAFVANNTNVEIVGRVEATEEEEGYTGDVVCSLCDKTITEGVTIPKIDPNKAFAVMNTAGGTLTYTDCTLALRGGNLDPVAIGETGEYGIKLTGDWQGFALENVSLLGAGERKVAMLIEYYIDANLTEDTQVFRYKIGDLPHVDLFTKQNNLAQGESALVYHVLTDEEMAKFTNSPATFTIQGCGPGANIVYIQSVQIVWADLLNIETDAPYGYTDFEKSPVTSLYPDILSYSQYNLTFADLEQHKDHPDREWLYRYLIVGGDLLTTAGNPKPVYIKLYAKEGYENDVITIGAIERVAGTFGAEEKVQMVDGVGDVIIAETCFTNEMNAGAMRLWWEEAAKLARIEIYDASTYCGRADADAALVERIHAATLEAGTNLALVGKVEPTEEEEGYSGDVYCACCDTLLAEGRVLPKIEVSDLPAPYAYFDTTNGVLTWANTTLADQGCGMAVSPIGATGEYGIKLTGDWQGFRMEGLTLPEGKDVAMVIEYYINADTSGSHQLFRYQAYEGMPSDLLPDGSDDHYEDLFTDQDMLVGKQSGLLVYTFSEADKEAIADGEFIFRILGCGPGANIVFIQSARLIDTKYLVGGGDVDYDFIEFVEKPVCEYYPNIVAVQGSGISISRTHEGFAEDGSEIRFGYIKVTRACVAPDQTTYKPVVVRFTFKEDCELTTMNWQYQGARRMEENPGIEWSHMDTPIENGVAEVVLDTACFANELNGLGSLRVKNTDNEPVLENLLKIEVIALTDKSPLQEIINNVNNDVVSKTTASANAYKALVEEMKPLLDDVWVTEEAIAEAVARLEEAKEALVDCDHSVGTTVVGYKAETCLVPGYTGDKACSDCGFIAEENKGEAIPAHETELRNVRPATCGEAGNTGDVWCLVCNKVARAGDPILQPPHTWNDGEVTKEATEDEKGIITMTCDVCGATKTTRFDFVAQLGDVDHNGKVDSTDARLVLQFAVKKIAPTALDLEVADVDGNGKVDSTDARLILQFAVKKIDKLPAAK